MSTQTLRVQVTDTNQRPRGVMTIEAQFDSLGPRPSRRTPSTLRSARCRSR